MNRYEVRFIHCNGDPGRVQLCAEDVHAALHKAQTAFDGIIKSGTLSARLLQESR